MPDITEQTRIPAPLGSVWPLLSNAAAVASCIPGAELAPQTDDGVWRGSIRVRFGPTVATFRGEATLDFDHDAHRCTIEGRGIDQRGASRALSSGTVMASAEGDQTLLSIEGRFTVTGPLEVFANAGGVHVARALLVEFADNMTRLVADRQGATAAAPVAMAPAPGATTSAPAATPPAGFKAAQEMSAFRLAWRALLSWLRNTLRKGSD